MYRLLKQPNGKYCIYDTVIDKIAHINITSENVDDTNERIRDLWYGDDDKNYERCATIEEYQKEQGEEFTDDNLDMQVDCFMELMKKIAEPNGEYEDLRRKYNWEEYLHECPCCGEEAEMFEREVDEDGWFEGFLHYVECENCGARGK